MKSHVGVGEESARQLPNSLSISDHMREATHRAETPWVSVLWSRLHNCGTKEKWKTSHCGHNPEAEVSAVAPSRAIRFPLQRKAFKKPLQSACPVRHSVKWNPAQHQTQKYQNCREKARAGKKGVLRGSCLVGRGWGPHYQKHTMRKETHGCWANSARSCMQLIKGVTHL